MPAKIDIPLVIPVDKDVPGGASLKRDLERLANGVYSYTQRVDQKVVPKPSFSPIRDLDTFAAFDVITRIAPKADQILYVQLPQLDTKNGGRTLQIQRCNTKGLIVVIPLDGSTINGRERFIILNHLHIVTVTYDGDLGWFTDVPGAVLWGENL